MYDFRPARPPPEGTAACAGRSASCCRWLCSPAWPCRPRPRPPRRRQRPARHGLVLLQHQLRGRRPADRAGHRHQHRPAAPAAADRAPHLRHTWFPADTAALPPPRLHGYMPLDLEPPWADADITWFNPSFFWASGALVSNVDDLDRFYDALFDGRLLPRRLLAEMLIPVDTGAPGAGYGLGLEISPCPAAPPWPATPGPCPATTRARSGCSA